MNYRTIDEAIEAAQAREDGAGLHILKRNGYRIAPRAEVPDLQAQGYEIVARISLSGIPLYWVKSRGVFVTIPD